MSYPETTYLSRRVRITIFLALVTSFFIISPLLIAYTMGYTYNWQTHTIEQTGVISVDFEPKDATVFLNGVAVPGESPLRLPNRRPGNYHITIAKDGYAPWDKDIEVGSKQTTYIKHISLFQNHQPTLVAALPAQNISALYPSFDGTYLAMVYHHDAAYSLTIYDTKTQTTSSIESTLNASSTLSWSPFSNMLSILTPQVSSMHITVISLSTFLPNRVDSYTIPSADHMQWSHSILNPGLYISDGDTIWSLTRGEKKLLGKIPVAEWPWFVDHSEKIWWYNNTTFELTSNETPANYISIDNNSPVDRIIDINSNRAIIAHPLSTRIILLKQKKSTTNNFETMSVSTMFSRYNSDTNEWLVWSPWELWTIYEDGRAVLLNRRSERIEQVIPIDKFGVELLTTPTSLAAFNPGYYTNYTLWQGGTIESVAVNQKIKTIFFLGTVGETHGLYALEY